LSSGPPTQYRLYGRRYQTLSNDVIDVKVVKEDIHRKHQRETMHFAAFPQYTVSSHVFNN